MTDTVEKVVIYAGQRLIKGGKTAHVWVVDGKEMLFSKPAGGVVGGLYSLTFTPDLKQVYSGATTYTMERIEDKAQIAAWEVEHRNALRVTRRAAAERKHKANPVLDEALGMLTPVIRKLRSQDDAYALGEIVKEHIIRTYYKG